MQTQDVVKGLHNCLKVSQPCVLMRICKHGKGALLLKPETELTVLGTTCRGVDLQVVRL